MTQLQGLITKGSVNENLVSEGLPTEGMSAEGLQGALPGTLTAGNPTHDTKQSDTGATPRPLSAHIKTMLEAYFRDLDGHPPADLYQMVLSEVEQPLLETVLRYTRGNQSKAAAMLGLNRGTLRKKLKQYDIN